MDTATMPDTDGKICSVCDKDVLRSRRFLLDGVVTHFCLTCARFAPKLPLVVGTTGINVCKQCCEVFSAASALCRHVKSQHSSMKQEFPCTQCEKKYNRKDNLENHFKLHHDANNNNLSVATEAKASGWTIIDQDETNSDVGQLQSDADVENCFSPDPDENSAQIDRLPAQLWTSANESSSTMPRKRRANAVWNDERAGNAAGVEVQKKKEKAQPVEELLPWLSALGSSLAKMPPTDQIEIKMAFTNIVCKKELEILQRK